ncbi:hypothetical protein LMG18090_04749 [Ralstonia mannitolilytica]|uniref:hypothetical protein n=1 Tax=Ralstonia mannitolilytica TaxID=105219 RepID=UPI0028F69B04|nr:hypothetical protein [Ralstonia mannitolilytica]CAJ0805193.1 hypothetical protein LMG18090_04749 [Ralstonia mannitolilytica]
MNDRELLEKAAKAAGIELVWDWEFPNRVKRSGNLAAWNPLEDDGDALRLAVKLGMNVWCDPAAVCMAEVLKHCLPRASEASGKDPNAATRRAIVRAAAAIGESHE